MSSSSDPSPKSKGKDGAAVPRDREVDGSPKHRTDRVPSAADVNPRDEDVYTDRDKPLVAGSRDARALHDHPPKGKDQLEVGSAGDAARPIKTGIGGKPIPPRGNM
jgi:hypothetical protein